MLQLQYKNHEMGCLNVCYIIGCAYAELTSINLDLVTLIAI